jgi:hypothetical protein
MLSVVRCTLVLRVYGERVKGYLGARRVGLSCIALRTFHVLRNLFLSYVLRMHLWYALKCI